MSGGTGFGGAMAGLGFPHLTRRLPDGMAGASGYAEGVGPTSGGQAGQAKGWWRDVRAFDGNKMPPGMITALKKPG